MTKTKKKQTTNSNKRYDPKKVKQRVQKKKKMKTSIKLAIILAYIAIVLITKLIAGTIPALAVAALGALILGIFAIYKVCKGKSKKKIITIFLILILTFGIICLALFGSFLLYIKTVAEPKYKEAELNKAELTSLYDNNGNEITKLGSEMREKVTYDQLPEVLVDAIIATEDSRFFQHNGFDAPRFLKATIGQLLKRPGAGGASTLSMQVVKNVFTNANADEGLEGIIRKFEDIYLAVFKLEKKHTKEEIIEYYVNNHFLGGNIYGVEEAAEAYFGKSVSDLNLSEAAILAGMFKSPNYYRPNVNPKNAEARRSTVLYLMRKHGYITKEEEEMANSIPVETLVADVVAPTNEYQDYIDTVVAEVRRVYKVNAYTTPLKIYTNLDREKQNAVNRVLRGETYSWIDDQIQTGVSVLDSATGKILAIGAGRNRTGKNSYNFATQIDRQPGSTAKPLFDYGPGMEYNDWSTYTLFDDSPYTYSNGRSIKNWDGGYFGTITLRTALSTSRNIPALKAFQQVENKKIIEFVTNLGIKPEIENERIHEAHSIGAFTGVSPLEMSAAYAAFSNGGYYNEPYSVSKIVFRSTGETKEHKEDKKQVMSDSTAFMISSVLQNVALTGGTPNNVACKTGTTNFDEKTMQAYNMPGDAIRDSWVIGYSTKTVIGMWYGYKDFSHESINQGYVLHNIPATVQKDRLFNALVNSGAMESDRAPFQQPSSVTRVGVAPGSNPPKLAAPGQSAVYEYFKKGTEPTEIDTSSVKINGPSNFKAVYNEESKKVTLSWNAINLGALANDSYGKFGYNVYYNNTLMTWTDKTSYTFDVAANSSPYGTYKVIATYKSYSGLQSQPSTVELKKKEEPKEEEKEDNETKPNTPPSTSEGGTNETQTP